MAYYNNKLNYESERIWVTMTYRRHNILAQIIKTRAHSPPFLNTAIIAHFLRRIRFYNGPITA